MQSLQQVQVTVEKSKIEEMFRETSQLLKNHEVMIVINNTGNHVRVIHYKVFFEYLSFYKSLMYLPMYKSTPPFWSQEMFLLFLGKNFLEKLIFYLKFSFRYAMVTKIFF